ncbi:rhomboid family intramembrane serine protease [Corynebacterium sp. S7]
MTPDTPTAGASGALYALMAVLIAVASRRSADLRAPLVLLVMNVLYTLISPGVSLWGHLGGLIAGALMAWPVTSRSKLMRWLSVLLVGGVSLVIILLY